MAASDKVAKVELGFVETVAPWRLSSTFFPSKVGGKPAWLSLKAVPSADNLKCGKCKEQCVFLLQVYAPIPNENACFHRTLFVFICKNSACCTKSGNSNFVVLRSQLPKVNEFYSDSPPDENSEKGNLTGAERYQDLCGVCGCAGPKRCGKCHTASYCSREHQIYDWKQRHKTVCGSALREVPPSTFPFPEYELVMEPEDYSESAPAKKTEEERMKEYEEYIASREANGMLAAGSKVDADLERMAQREEDKQFERFKKRITLEPEQVLRYQRGGEVLWVSEEGVPTSGHIPHCPCGAPRVFEFQILPQLLTHLEIDCLGESIDWGTLAVYTCAHSCSDSGPYHEEFLWTQDVSADQTATS